MIKNIAPDIPLRDVIWGVLPFVGLMIFAVVVLCMFPGIATWLADAVMGVEMNTSFFGELAADRFPSAAAR